MTEIPEWSPLTDTDFVRWMIREVGVSAVPGSSFHAPPDLGARKVRFMFAKRDETLHQAGERLQRLRGRAVHAGSGG